MNTDHIPSYTVALADITDSALDELLPHATIVLAKDAVTGKVKTLHGADLLQAALADPIQSAPMPLLFVYKPGSGDLGRLVAAMRLAKGPGRVEGKNETDAPDRPSPGEN